MPALVSHSPAAAGVARRKAAVTIAVSEASVANAVSVESAVSAAKEGSVAKGKKAVMMISMKATSTKAATKTVAVTMTSMKAMGMKAAVVVEGEKVVRAAVGVEEGGVAVARAVAKAKSKLFRALQQAPFRCAV